MYEEDTKLQALVALPLPPPKADVGYSLIKQEYRVTCMRQLQTTALPLESKHLVNLLMTDVYLMSVFLSVSVLLVLWWGRRVPSLVLTSTSGKRHIETHSHRHTHRFRDI